jgi:L-seryl-tRNA(Ser) seleniumtransferase
MRTYRVEKLIYGALEATLDSYRFGRAASEIPVVQMIAMKKEELAGRARLFARRLRGAVPEGVQVNVSQGDSVVGGGSCPECRLPTALVAVESSGLRPNLIESRLRLHNPPVIVRLEEDKLLLDLRTVFPDQEKILIDSLRKALE